MRKTFLRIFFFMLFSVSLTMIGAASASGQTTEACCITNDFVSEETPNEQYWEEPIEVFCSLNFMSQNEYSDKISEEVLDAFARTLYGEANGVQSKMEKAAVIWSALNRFDAGYGSLLGIIENKSHYNGYSKNHPVTAENKALCLDVLCRYYAEKDGYQNVGRVLPSDYLWFRGDGAHNYFRNAFHGGSIWDWSLPNPYES